MNHPLPAFGSLKSHLRLFRNAYVARQSQQGANEGCRAHLAAAEAFPRELAPAESVHLLKAEMGEPGGFSINAWASHAIACPSCTPTSRAGGVVGGGQIWPRSPLSGSLFDCFFGTQISRRCHHLGSNDGINPAPLARRANSSRAIACCCANNKRRQRAARRFLAKQCRPGARELASLQAIKTSAAENGHSPLVGRPQARSVAGSAVGSPRLASSLLARPRGWPAGRPLECSYLEVCISSALMDRFPSSFQIQFASPSSLAAPEARNHSLTMALVGAHARGRRRLKRLARAARLQT